MVENALPQIIDNDTFESVQKIIDAKATHCTYDTNHIYILSGLMYCSSCNKVLVGSSKTGGRSKTKRYYYQCQSHKAKACDTKEINADYIESFVLDIVTPLANKCITSGDIENAIKPQIKECKRLIKQLEKNIMQNNRQTETYYTNLTQVYSNEFLMKNVMEKLEQVVNLDKKLNEDLEVLKSKINMLDGLITSNVTISKKDLLNDRLKARTLCKILIDKIIVDESNDEIEIIIK